jgi:hypothetical protein
VSIVPACPLMAKPTVSLSGPAIAMLGTTSQVRIPQGLFLGFRKNSLRGQLT